MSQRNETFTFAKVWQELLEGIKHIYQFQAMTPSIWMQLYNCIYKYCTTSNGQPTADIVGEELYTHIKNHLTDYLENICQNATDLHGDSSVLHFYTDNWNKYKFPSQVINGLCLYLNSHWVRQAIESQRKDVYEVFTTAMKAWENIFFKSLNRQVTQACLNLIEAERNNHVINTNLISGAIQSYVELGKYDFFAVPFLEDTEQFYRLEATKFLADNSVTDYLKKVAQRLKEEVHRVQSYLHPSTLSGLIKKVEDILIRDQLDVIYTEAQKLLDNEKHQDLALLFELVNRVPNATDKLIEIVQNHIYQMGMNTIKPSALNDPEVYIETILGIHTKFSKLVQDIFNSRQDFIAAFNRAGAKFINNNAVTQSAGTTTKSPELLARYCDIFLRKGNRGVEESDLEEKVDQIMTVFNYMEDKDVFENFYRNLFAERLVNQLSASDDYELLMITRLQQVCGIEYTSKLKSMFKDIDLSKGLTEQYLRDCENRPFPDINLSVMVLTSHIWPFSAASNLFVLPIEIKLTLDSFTNFYNHQHSGRKLMLHYQYSKGHLHTSFTSTRYILQVSIYEMTILLLFNKQTTWRVEQIQDETQIENEILFQVLCTLVKKKLLRCTEINGGELKESDIKLDFHINLVEDFKNKNIKININVPLKTVEQKDNENLYQTIDKDREWVIEAAIVRIMKDRKVLKHSLLMQEVIQQLKSRFIPKVPLIKKCIEFLVEKEYLERNSDEKDVLRYVA